MFKAHTGKLILFIDYLLSGGAQRQLVVLANELHRRNYDVTLLTYYPGDQLSQFLDPGITVVNLPRHSKYDLGFLFRLQRWFRTQAPDAIISYLTTTNFWARIAGHLAGVPVIITSERNVSINHRRGRVLMERLLAPLSTRIIVNAHEIKRCLIDFGIPENKIEVIHNGVDCTLFHRQPDTDIAALRTTLGIMPEELAILLPGRISRQKNHLLLIDAVLALDSDRPSTRIVFAGNEFDQDILRQMRAQITAARREHQFIFLGQRSDMPLLYSAADIVVVPSLWEGFPNVVVEAMACGTPVIASDISDNRIIIGHGETGLIFTLDEGCDGLKKNLLALLSMTDDQRKAMGEKAATRVAELCSIHAFGDRYVHVLNEAYQNRRF